MTPTQIPSPNFGPRKGGLIADMVVLHYTAMENAQAAIERLYDPAAEVSAHYVISASGEVTQLVAEDQRAWHAGAGSWGGLDDINSRSIGIELDNRGAHPFSAALMNSLENLLADIKHSWSIPPERVIGHSDMAPARKFDPGPRFDWNRLAKSGLSIWPQDLPQTAANWGLFLKDAERFGYPVLADEQSRQALLDAFRARFLPRKSGDLTDLDCATIAALARDFPAKALDPSNAAV